MEIAGRREKKGTADERDRFHVHIDPPSPRVKLGQHGVGRLRGGGGGGSSTGQLLIGFHTRPLALVLA